MSFILIGLYVANIVFTLFTHRDYLSTADDDHGKEHTTAWSSLFALGALLGATILVGFMSEFLMGSLEGFTEAFGLSEFFVGLIIVLIVGNAAEHAAAVFFALKKQDGLGRHHRARLDRVGRPARRADSRYRVVFDR